MSKLDHLGWVVYRSFGVGPYRFGVRTTSRRFGAWLDSAFAAYRIDDKTEPYLSAVIVERNEGEGQASRRDFHLLYRRTDPLVRTLDTSEVTSTLVGELEACTYPEREDAVYSHAALLSIDDRNVLIPAVLASGIASLGRRVERMGISIPVTFSVAIDTGSGEVVPIRPALDLPPDVLGSAGVAGNGHRPKVTEPTQVDALFSLGRGSDAGVQPISRARGLHALASVSPNLPTMGRGGLDGLGRLVAGARCYQLERGSVRRMLDDLLLAVGGAA